MSTDADSDAAGPARPWRRTVIIAVAVVLLLAAVGSAIAVSRANDDPPTAELTVDWGGSEGNPSCVYDPKASTVEAKLTIKGEAPRRRTVTVTVTAYADENTSQPVGSSSRSVEVEGTVDMSLVVVIPVDKPPHVGEDDETACARDVKY